MFTSFLAGLLFGCGLILSGMSNPAKVLAFLDISGRWDPSLAFVMIGAILVAAIAFRVGGWPTLLFVASMIAGMTVYEAFERISAWRAARLHPAEVP